MRQDENRDYVAVTYRNEKFTNYPDRLANFLASRYQLVQGMKILDVGCGRGEYLKGFIRFGLDGFGLDQSRIAASLCPGADMIQSNLENQEFPFVENSFDVIFAKSVLEHFYYPERIVQEIYRILKPGGLALAMVPDWESVYKTFYVDYTHRTPFTLNSLEEIFVIHGFNDVKVEKFRQLPFLWKSPWLKPFCAFVAFFSPRRLRQHSKLVRFSQEIMLLSSATKPQKQPT